MIGRAQSLARNTKRSEVVNLHASLKGVPQTGANLGRGNIENWKLTLPPS